MKKEIEKGMEQEAEVRSLTSLIDVPFVDEAIEAEDSFSPVATSKLDAQGRARATGRRKRASARIWISTGDSMTVNGKKFEEYFPQESLRRMIMEPAIAVGMTKLKVFCTVVGGGSVGQAGALRHGLALALINFDPTFRPVLRANDYVTRDKRKKERKTPGFRTARKPQQFSKR